ncbi:hypothetical protein SDC9_97198 [bioreactor metagenome]|uniref:Uncharacterized protein n=1 Tax=bioreactor metagenome TaxID=1076179 RepID=A0A645ACN1_9ZZZZ
MRGVRDEGAQLAFGPGPGPQRLVDVVDQQVERVADVADLGAGLGQVGRHPAAAQIDGAALQRHRGDVGGDLGDPGQRTQ